MRDNGPVTQKDVPLTNSDQLVSSTTAKGVVTDVNDVFCEYSGFTKEEIIGQAHNIVRHKDMPQAAFKSLWDTTTSGRPWRGIVKNRCKNGDHYWVDAYVTPAFENNAIVSLESVRQKADPASIGRAEVAYANLNAGKNPLPIYIRIVEKNLNLFKTGGLGLLCLILCTTLGGNLGWALGLLMLIALLIIPTMLSTHKIIDKQLSAFNDDDLTQYIYTGHLTPTSRIQFLHDFHQIHLHTVLERMDQQGEELKHLAEDNMSRAKDQFAAIEKEKIQLDGVASSVQEMSHSVREIAQTAERSATTTNEANASAKKGLEVLTSTTEEIERLVNTMAESEAAVDKLAKDSEEIRSVISVISGIAEQTNLLALNAAIEAARAGEQGRGFAVVADEVRNLASKTQESTETISDIINKLVSATGNTVTSIRTGTEISNESKISIGTAQNSITELVSAIEKINDNTEVIADLSSQQATASDEISKNSEAVLSLTEELSISAGETLKFSDDLNNQAAKQSALIGRFR